MFQFRHARSGRLPHSCLVWNNCCCQNFWRAQSWPGRPMLMLQQAMCKAICQHRRRMFEFCHARNSKQPQWRLARNSSRCHNIWATLHQVNTIRVLLLGNLHRIWGAAQLFSATFLGIFQAAPLANPCISAVLLRVATAHRGRACHLVWACGLHWHLSVSRT